MAEQELERRNRRCIISAEYRAKNKDKCNKRALASYRKRVYGLTTEAYEKLFEDCNYTCTLCNKVKGSITKLNIDHDHITGKIRGILCNSCNMGLGYFGDTEESIIKLLNYLQPEYGGLGASC